LDWFKNCHYVSPVYEWPQATIIVQSNLMWAYCHNTIAPSFYGALEPPSTTNNMSRKKFKHREPNTVAV